MIGGDESALPGTEVHYLRSEHVGDEFKIMIGRCGTPGATPTPVVFISDANWYFGTAVELITPLNLTGYLPSLLVVGVGYRASGFTDALGPRVRDFTPTVGRKIAGHEHAATGGADRYLAFLRDELKPWLREHYADCDPDDSMFVGHSLGGLFGTYVLLNAPDTFARYGLGSSSLYYDGELMFAQEEEYAKAHRDLDAKVYFSVGAFETPAGDVRFRKQLPEAARAKAEADAKAAAEAKTGPIVDMAADTERLVAQLRSRDYPSLRIECEVLPDEYHETSPGLHLSRALRYLFDAPR
jgi:predicted alpha/beta superfamily hydrolase